MANGTGDIVIKGGSSVELEYDNSVYKREGLDKPEGVDNPEGLGKHKNKDMKLKKVVVKDENGTIQFDSDDKDVSGWEVKASCKK